MSETPRTDSKTGYYSPLGEWRFAPDQGCVKADFARKLEKENNELRRIICDTAKVAGVEILPECPLLFMGFLPDEVRLRINEPITDRRINAGSVNGLVDVKRGGK